MSSYNGCCASYSYYTLHYKVYDPSGAVSFKVVFGYGFAPVHKRIRTVPNSGRMVGQAKQLAGV
jgi:hypothetical protein